MLVRPIRITRLRVPGEFSRGQKYLFSKTLIETFFVNRGTDCPMVCLESTGFANNDFVVEYTSADFDRHYIL